MKKLQTPTYPGPECPDIPVPVPRIRSTKFKGRKLASTGYVHLCLPGHRLADEHGYVYEHRIVAEHKVLRRELRPGEVVHHIDGDKTNNAPENLEVFPSVAAHVREHSNQNPNMRQLGEENPVIACACGCGGELLKFDEAGRPRSYIYHHQGSHVGPLVLRALQDGPLKTFEIEARIGQPVHSALKELKRKGLVVSVVKGTWRKA